MKLFLDTAHVRAWPGGPGAFKVGGNYAPTVLPQVAAAKDHGCSQVGVGGAGGGGRHNTAGSGRPPGDEGMAQQLLRRLCGTVAGASTSSSCACLQFEGYAKPTNTSAGCCRWLMPSPRATTWTMQSSASAAP